MSQPLHYLAESARVDALTRSVIDDLRGTVDEVENVEPRRTFCIGVLSAPRPDDGGGPNRQRRYNFESIGFSARVDPDEQRVSGTVDAKVKVWYRVVPSFEQQSAFVGTARQATYQIEPRYAAQQVEFTGLPFSVEPAELGGRSVGETAAANRMIADAFARAEHDIRNGPHARRLFPGSANISLKADDLVSADAYYEALGGTTDLPLWEASLDVSTVQTADGTRLTLTLSNRTTSAKQHQAELFDAALSVELTAGRFSSREFHADRHESRYRTRSWGKGINAVLEVDDTDDRRAAATTVPSFRQERADHRAVPGAMSPAVLSGNDAERGVEALIQHLYDYRQTWTNDAGRLPPGDKRDAAERDLAAFSEEIAVVELGLAALREDPRLLSAFRLMNKAASRLGSASEPFSWRPFQIGFIVAMLPSLLARERPEAPWLEELMRVDVLWFPTGGGKSEATFGVILAAMFYDRLRGKEFGVTAWMRYPLRMLSIQQLQRLVEFVVVGEAVRAEAKIVGDEFSVGYYVGEQNTPNWLTDKRNTHPITRYKQRVDREGGSFMRVLQKCPYADCTDRARIDVEIDDRLQVARILHVCKACGRTAPIHISDSEVYRYIPSVVVGTVDRLARAGQAQEFMHLFGQVDSQCPQHGYARHKRCVESGCGLTKRQFLTIPKPYDPAPSLLIQDELHLLKESLGTYDSHYEGFLDSFSRAVGKRLPAKRIAATATIEGFERHVRELYGYGRPARRFPTRGPSETESAYVTSFQEPRDARVYVGIMPNGLTSDQVAARVALVVHEQARAREATDKLDGLDANYDVTLVYAKTKDSLGNVGAELKGQLPLLRSLSGERSLEEVRQTIDVLADDRHKPVEERVPAVVATSIISHGVDVSRLNVMTFSGFPGKAADYIQSSSRVGRTNVGLVFLVCDPTREMDRSTFAHFYEYHERLYSLVQPVPIIRYSQSAVRRTFSGVFAASLLGTINAVKDGDFGEGRKAAAGLVAGVPTEAEVLAAVDDAYDIAQLDVELRAKYSNLTRRLAHVAHSQVVNNGDEWATAQRLRPKPISSLREVQEAIGFDVTPRRNREVQILRRARR